MEKLTILYWMMLLMNLIQLILINYLDDYSIQITNIMNWLNHRIISIIREGLMIISSRIIYNNVLQ